MLAIDHIVIAAIDPKQAAEEFAQRQKVKVVQGGKHDSWGTYNYLAYFSNESYIEWLGIFDEAVAKRSTNPLIIQLVDRLERQEEGFFQFALRTKSIAKFVDHFKKNELSFTGPISGSRQKPNGSRLEWSMLFTDELPFLIEWGKTLNLPDDPGAINKRQLNYIQMNDLKQNVFNHVFNTKTTKQPIQLTNGTLHFSSEKELNFKIS